MRAAAPAVAAVLLLAGCSAATPAASPTPSPSTAAWQPSLLYEWYGTDGRKNVLGSNADGTAGVPIATKAAPGLNHGHADWSPDGKRIAFAAWDDDAGVYSIWITDADGSHSRRVAGCATADCPAASFPAFSPDGTHLLYDQDDRGTTPGTFGPSHLVSLDLKTGTTTVIVSSADGAHPFSNPRWFPDGKRIVVELEHWSSTSTTDAELVDTALGVVDVANGAIQRITDPKLNASHPDVRASDGLIVFSTYDLRLVQDTTKDSNLYTIQANGTGLTELTHERTKDGTRVSLPTWTPDGTGITATVAEMADGRIQDAHVATVAPDGTVTDLGYSGASSRARPS